MPKVKSHPYAKLFPLITGQELEDLAADIDAHGQNEPIVTYQGMILDGRNRHEACVSIGKKPKFTAFTGNDKEALAYVLSANLKRRHLTESQRAMVAAEMANLTEGRPNSANLQSFVPLISQAKAAEAVSVSTRTVADAVAVKNVGIEELADAVKAGEVSVSAAAEVAKLPPKEQRAAVAKGAKGVAAAAKKSRAARKPKAKAEPVSQPAATEEDKATDEPSEPETTPERLRRESIEAVQAVETLCRDIDAIKARCDDLKQMPACYSVHFQSASSQLKAVRQGLWAGRPQQCCPYCKGEGSKEDKPCTGCRTHGWVSKTMGTAGKRAMGTEEDAA